MGTYAAVKFDHPTRKSIHQYCATANIPNTIRPDKLHTTLLYSHKELTLYSPTDKYVHPLVAYPVGMDIWDSTNDQGQVEKCLVVLLDCPQLIDRHNLLMKDHGATYTFPNYQPHITLSYNVGDLDPASLPFFENYVPSIIIVGEYSEALNEPINTAVDAINKTVVINA